MSFNNRSDALIELLEEFTQEGHEYVLAGGYAVSAFNARFSTDLDVVAPDSKVDVVDYEPEKYPGAYVRFGGDEPLITLYRTGKYILTGASSEAESENSRNELLAQLERSC